MRLLFVGISSLALTACSMGGYHYGSGHGDHAYVNPAYGSGYSACSFDPCSSGQWVGHTQTVAPMPQPVVHPPATWTPPPSLPPAPMPPAPCATHVPSPPSPCAGGAYSVAAQGSGHYGMAGYGSASYGHPQTPAAHAYGQPAPAYGAHHGYGMRGAFAPRQAYKYATLGATWYDVSEAPAGIQGRLGYQSANLLGAELEGSIGVISEVSPFDQPNPPDPNIVGQFEDGVDYQIAGFGVARLPVARNVSLHMRAGYHQTKSYTDATVNGLDRGVDRTDDGVAYGVGAEFNVTPVDALRADFTRYSRTGDDMDSVSLSYLRRF
ncbi:MAG: outer membrane beta-barrel protein [Pseudomonadota bacterium]